MHSGISQLVLTASFRAKSVQVGCCTDLHWQTSSSQQSSFYAGTIWNSSSNWSLKTRPWKEKKKSWRSSRHPADLYYSRQFCRPPACRWKGPPSWGASWGPPCSSSGGRPAGREKRSSRIWRRAAAAACGPPRWPRRSRRGSPHLESWQDDGVHL